MSGSLRAKDAEPLPFGCSRADGVRGRAVAVVTVLHRDRAKIGKEGLHIGIADAGQALACRAAGGNRRQALLGIAALASEVSRGQAFQQRTMRRIEMAQRDEMFGQGL